MRLLGGLGLMLLATGCEPECPAQPTACAPMAEVHVTVPDGTPEAYELSLGADDEAPSRCLVVLPLPNDWPFASRQVATCVGESPAYVYVQRAAHGDCTTGWNGSSCSVDAGPTELVVERSGTPTRITLALTRGSQKFSPRSVEPAYAEFRPDGPSCGMGCQRAATQLQLAELTEAE